MDNIDEYINEVFNKLKKILNVTSDRQLALKLDVMPSSFSNTIKRGLLPYEKILFFAKKEGLSLDDIFLLNNHSTINRAINNIENTSTEKELECSKDLCSIQILNDEKNLITIPLNAYSNQKLRAFINDKKIYIIDIDDREIEHNTYYLIKSSETYFAMYISIDLDGSYSLKDDDNNIKKIMMEDFKKIEVIGKINFKLIRETFI